MILFLDFDGVLHPDAAYLERGRPVLRGEGELFMWAGLLVDVLASHPEVRIVLSTSWARELRFARARDYLPVELRPLVIGATWHSAMGTDGEYRPLGRETWWDQATRYQQIRRYVDRARLTNWIAVDDHPEGWSKADCHRLVVTSSARGLSDPTSLARLANLLSSSPPAPTRTAITIPATSRTRYLSGMAALNLPSPTGTGDWHMEQTFFRQRAKQSRSFISGIGCPTDTTAMLGDAGVYDCTTLLDELGVLHESTVAYAASHARAITDLVLGAVLRGESPVFVDLDDWMPRDSDKQGVFNLLAAALKHLTLEQRDAALAWMDRNERSVL